MFRPTDVHQRFLPFTTGPLRLAHLSLLSGVDVRDQYAYTSLMASGRETIVTNFARRGYRTVAPMLLDAFDEPAKGSGP